jgi:hypothetical protein
MKKLKLKIKKQGVEFVCLFVFAFFCFVKRKKKSNYCFFSPKFIGGIFVLLKMTIF